MVAMVTPLPTAPSRTGDKNTFPQDMDTFLAAMVDFVPEVNAQAVELASQYTADNYNGTSASSVTMGFGAKTLNVGAGKIYVPGVWLTIAKTSSPATIYMRGQVTSYNSGSGVLNFNVTDFKGSGSQSGWTLSLGVAPPKEQRLSLSALFSSTSITPVQITDATNGDWQIAVLAGESYRIRCTGLYRSATSTTGARLTIDATTAVGQPLGYFYGAVSNTAGASKLEQTISALPADFVTTAVNPINSPHHIGFEMIFHCTTSGTLNIKWGAEVAAAGAVQIDAGSVLSWETI